MKNNSSFSGSVKPYVGHIFVEYEFGKGTLPKDLGTYWAPDLEKEGEPLHPIVKALRAKKEETQGLVKVTAFSPIRDAGAPGTAHPAPSTSSHCNAIVFTDSWATQHRDVPMDGDGIAVRKLDFFKVFSSPIQNMQSKFGTQHLHLLPSILYASQSLFGTAGSPLTAGLHLFVCTHGSRDRRCSVMGEPIIEALHRASLAHGYYPQVNIYRCSHIGGHAYAGNVLCFASDGKQLLLKDWLGGVNTKNTERVLQTLVVGLQTGSIKDSESVLQSSVLRPLWRGRMGLGEEEQIAAHKDACASCSTECSSTSL